MDYQVSGNIEERFLGAEGRVAQWSVGGAMFGLTAAVVQMLIRSLVIKRNKVCKSSWLFLLTICLITFFLISGK